MFKYDVFLKANVLLLIAFVNMLQCKVIEICPTCPIQNIQSASKEANPGDTILIRQGIYTSSSFISNLQGTKDRWITITAKSGEEVIFRNQSTAMQLTDPAYLRISNLIFDQQTANGVNIDDGGSYNTPAHDIIIENCEWRSMNATGNNDMLKMSGVDNFLIKNCTFKNGSPGGSGIDMVGCHNGIIENCLFINQGSNSIQSKGGTSQIIIQKNKFINGGLRTLNIGGSTGLEFFRPSDAKYEAKEIFVYSNIFIGSQSPIAFVGAIDCKVINNIIFLPTKWAIRILQENTNPGFAECSRNSFINNIVYIDKNASNPTINIGAGTKPETFFFSNNLWFNKDNLNWNGPNLPVTEQNGLKNFDPQISIDNQNTLFIDKNSPAKAKGLDLIEPKEDFNGNLFNSPRSIGAIELNPKTTNFGESINGKVKVFPNPAKNYVIIDFGELNAFSNFIEIYDILGYPQNIKKIGNIGSQLSIDISELTSGLYFIKIDSKIVYFLVQK